MDKKIDISIDIDGTINSTDTSISFFQIMTHLLHPDPDVSITVLTGREPGTEAEIADELAQMNILYDQIVITDNKQDYIKKNISVVFENEDESMKTLGPDILVLKVREEGNYNFQTYKWYGDQNTVEIIE